MNIIAYVPRTRERLPRFLQCKCEVDLPQRAAQQRMSGCYAGSNTGNENHTMQPCCLTLCYKYYLYNSFVPNFNKWDITCYNDYLLVAALVEYFSRPLHSWMTEPCNHTCSIIRYVHPTQFTQVRAKN